MEKIIIIRARLTLTYDALGSFAGTGAHLQRIFGIFALSKLLRLSYMHSVIQNLGVSPMDPFQDEESINTYIKRINSEYFLPSTKGAPTNFDATYRFDRLTYKRLVWLILNSIIRRKNYLLVLGGAYPIIEKFTSSYKAVQNIFPATAGMGEHSAGVKTIVLHIRQDFNEHILPGEATIRGLSNSYYLDILHKIITDYCDKDKGIELIIVTDAPPADFTYVPVREQLVLWAAFPKFQNGCVEIKGRTFQEFNSRFLEKFLVIHGGDPMLAIQEMRGADYLVMSRSSLSYVGAILNTKGVVFYPPNFGSKPMPKWKQGWK